MTGVLYNLYADVALGLNFVPREVYEVQDKFYPTVATQYGVVLDTRGSWTKLDWELFTAAVSSTSTRDMFIRSVARWIGQTPSDRALTDLYDVNTGDFASVRRFTARPVVGGSFALMIV